ncbi:hypothetical protein OESDEN_16221 [Oesophagostomum dentatum]|uniref:Tc1-like transposase DDE domain-containing protein n=1 Tax=Oesophagostomum dentatum TaxID=61180 RepID=A0A0B1SGM6_OESDE|nr:hypothetical protein OESDEN_16221 [Oesophagostomum dentatum]
MSEKFLNRFYSQQPVQRKLPYRSRSLAPHLQVINRAIEDSFNSNSSNTIPAIRKSLEERFIQVSETQLRRFRDQLGYHRRSTKYCQIIREANKEKRLEFCVDNSALNEKFHECIFTDECTIQADCSVKHCFVKDGDYSSRMRKRAKHPVKLHLWGGISARGYAKLVQDNSPIHKSRYTTQKLISWNVDVIDWPPESPDLNPIELVLGNLKNCLRKKKMRNAEELQNSVLDYWRTLTPEICARYVNDIQKKMPRILEARGGNIYEGR